MVTEDGDRHCCSNSSGIQPWNGLTAVGYSLATSLAFLLVITFTSYFSTRGSNDADVDEAALMRHPKVVYSQAVKVTGSGGFCCIYINSTTNPPSEGMTGTGDPVHISVMIMLIIITYFCIEWTIMNLNSQFGLEAVAAPTNVEVGIDRATLMRYPKVTYSQANLEDKGTTATCCSICLSDFEDTDVLRLLPQCGHPFHLDCVDPWLRSHSSCPICRSFPEPRAEVVSSTWPTRSR